MLPLKTILYLGLFVPAALGSVVYHPFIGVYAYLLTYNINPLGQWWGSYLPGFFERYSFIIALAIVAGIFLNWTKLRFKSFLDLQEILLIIFLMIIWFSVVAGSGWYVDYNVYKMSKVVFILLMASHVITSRRYYEGTIWILIFAGLYLGFEMYSGSGVSRGGRFHAGVGGSDFDEGNFLAAHFAFILPFIGVMFLKSSWKARGLSLLSAVFIINSIVMTRSRGIFLSLAVGLIAAFFLSTRLGAHRKKIVALLLLGVAGGVYLTDPGFWGRMETIRGSDNELVETRDVSSTGRLVAWRGAWAMAKDNPLGVGVGGFFDRIGMYEPSIPGKDTHNTFLRCLAELGFPGFVLLLFLILNAFRTVFVVDREARDRQIPHAEDFHLHAFALKIALIVYLSAAMFISSTYIEEFYWLLMMPVFLKRALENEVPEEAVEKTADFEVNRYQKAQNPDLIS